MAEKKSTASKVADKVGSFFGFSGVKPEKDVTSTDIQRAEMAYGYDPVTVSMLLGSGKRTARSRQQICEKLHFMMGDPIISSAIRLHVTNALGGDPATGNRVFIEPTPTASAQGRKMVEELNNDLAGIFNAIAYPLAFNGIGFGDAYARVYVKEKVGIQHIYTDEMVWPPLVQSYEKGGKTVGFTVAVGSELTQRLTVTQMARLKMPRSNYVAQNSVLQKAVLTSIKEDDYENLPIQPAMIGGSMLLEAEEPYDYLQTALCGLVSQRIISSIDENILALNMDGMTKEQKKNAKESLTKILTASKKRVQDAITSGKPITERIYHVLPVNAEKQVTQISQFNGTSGSQSYTIDDVMMYLKMVCGAIGIDLSMLGFADILSGGLGEGGFFRQSAQAAEKSQMVRSALFEIFNDLIDIHCFHKYGYTLEALDRPYRVNFYGSISALEGEKAATRERNMNGTMVMAQAIGGLKELGLKEKTLKQIMMNDMGLDDDIASLIAKDLQSAPVDGDGGFGGGGGGFGNDAEGVDVDGSGEAEGDGVDDNKGFGQ